MRSIKVNLDKKTSSSYEIRIGFKIIDRIALIIAKNNKAIRYVLITDDCVGSLYARQMMDSLKDVGLNINYIDFPAGESSKNINTVMDIVGRLLELGADRGTMLIALGGGVVGDLVGFIASIYMRGIPYIQIPTTLIGQVDSSIGGKTAIDLTHGKNLLGTFHQPRAVFADLALLETLPQKEFNNGLAEIIKYGVIDDENIFRMLERNMDAIKNRDSVLLTKVVESCCRIKKSIVEIDEKEQGLRRLLNFGHTLGHAIEAVSKYAISHGEGVALGMIAAARISEKKKYLDTAQVQRIEEIILMAGLPVKTPRDFSAENIISRLAMDKKKKGDVVHFVLLKKIGMPFVNGGIASKLIADVIEEMR